MRTKTKADLTAVAITGAVVALMAIMIVRNVDIAQAFSSVESAQQAAIASNTPR